MVPNTAPKSRRKALIQSANLRRQAVTNACDKAIGHIAGKAESHAARYHAQRHWKNQHKHHQHKLHRRWMRSLSHRITERRIRALWFKKVEAVAFHTRFASRNISAIGTLALCAAVPVTVPTILATSPRTILSHTVAFTPAPETTAVHSATTPDTTEQIAPAQSESTPAQTENISAAESSPLSIATSLFIAPKTAVRVAIDGNVRRETVSLPPKATVAQALQALKIELAGTDRVWPALNSPAKDGMSIRVTRVRVETRKRREAVPFETLYQPSASLRIARQDIVQNGQSGVREIAEQV
jgi:hypothetical protein